MAVQIRPITLCLRSLSRGEPHISDQVAGDLRNNRVSLGLLNTGLLNLYRYRQQAHNRNQTERGDADRKSNFDQRKCTPGLGSMIHRR
jgi:hypothetical protein